MIFSSYIFIFAFLPLVLLGFYVLKLFNPLKAKIFLILSSLFFYGFWNILYLPLLLISILTNYTLAHLISRNSGGGNSTFIAESFSILVY